MRTEPNEDLGRSWFFHFFCSKSRISLVRAELSGSVHSDPSGSSGSSGPPGPGVLFLGGGLPPPLPPLECPSPGSEGSPCPPPSPPRRTPGSDLATLGRRGGWSRSRLWPRASCFPGSLLSGWRCRHPRPPACPSTGFPWWPPPAAESPTEKDFSPDSDCIAVCHHVQNWRYPSKDGCITGGSGVTSEARPAQGSCQFLQGSASCPSPPKPDSLPCSDAGTGTSTAAALEPLLLLCRLLAWVKQQSSLSVTQPQQKISRDPSVAPLPIWSWTQKGHNTKSKSGRYQCWLRGFPKQSASKLGCRSGCCFFLRTSMAADTSNMSMHQSTPSCTTTNFMKSPHPPPPLHLEPGWKFYEEWVRCLLHASKITTSSTNNKKQNAIFFEQSLR